MSTDDVGADSPPTLRLGLCQVHTEEWAVEANLERTLDALVEAAAQGAQLAITPECVLHGYAGASDDASRQRLREVAERPDGPRLARVREQARALGMDVIVGFAEAGEGDQVHNAAAFIARDGEIVNVYRKVHLRAFEDVTRRGGFTAGREFVVAERAYGEQAFNVGTMICFDREVPESVRCLRALGSWLVACPLACNTADMAAPGNRADNEMITRCRAAENELFIAVVNHAGRFNGGSFVVGPKGELLQQMSRDAGVAVVDLPLGIVPATFHGNPLGWMGWGYRRPEIYRSYLDR